MTQVKLVCTPEEMIAHLESLRLKPDCKHETRKDLTQGKGEIRNIYCPTCDWHLYKGIEYTKEEWYKWINDPEGYK